MMMLEVTCRRCERRGRLHPAIGGAAPVPSRPGFAEMLDALVGNGERTIIVESPDRFARDLAVQLAGHDHLRGLGVNLVPASAPDHFIEDTPTAILVRQGLGAISEFEKATIVAKLKAARDRKRELTSKCGGRKNHIELNPEVVALARRLRRKRNGNRPSLRDISAELARLGHLNMNGRPFAAESINPMLGRRRAAP